MIVDCAHPRRKTPDKTDEGRCAEASDACRGCLVSALLDTPDGIADLTPGELRAIETFELAGFEIELLETPEPPVVVPMLARRHVA